jgi:hypothetical protein
MKSMKYVLIFSLFILNSCEKIECPAFENNLQGWLPNSVHEKLFYTNNNNDTLTFMVTSKNISSGYKITRNCKCDCEASGELYFNNTHLLIYQNNFKTENNYTLNFEYTISFDNSYGNLYLSTDNINNITKDTTINSKHYKVIVLTRDTIDNNYEIWKLIHAKDVGIIKMYNRKTNDVWTLVD